MNNLTIEDLYNGTATIQVKFQEKELDYDVEMFDNIAKVYGDRFVPDCKISNFGYNQWFRTNLGMSNSKKYSSIKTLKDAITKTAKSKGLTVEAFSFKDI